ncbi:hypothetical protein D3C73_359810 [compost metagenome]
MALGLRFRNQGHRPHSAIGLTRRLHKARHDTMPAFGGDDITRHRNYSRGTERTWPECRVRFILTPGDSATISPSSDGNRVREPASFTTGRNSVSGDGRECGQTGTDKSRKDQMNRPGQADQDLPYTQYHCLPHSRFNHAGASLRGYRCLRPYRLARLTKTKAGDRQTTAHARRRNTDPAPPPSPRKASQAAIADCDPCRSPQHARPHRNRGCVEAPKRR